MGIENFMKYIEAIMLLIPLIDKLVTMFEGLFSKLGSGQGAAKKEAVTEVAKAVMANTGLELPDEALSTLIDSSVKIKKLTGEFVAAAPQAPSESEGILVPEGR